MEQESKRYIITFESNGKLSYSIADFTTLSLVGTISRIANNSNNKVINVQVKESDYIGGDDKERTLSILREKSKGLSQWLSSTFKEEDKASIVITADNMTINKGINCINLN